MPTRIAVGSIFTESNHFVAALTRLEDFERAELRRGEEMLCAEGGVVGGALAALREGGAEIVPLLSASACPGGPIEAGCFRMLREELLGRLEGALPVDGVLLLLHGAATVEDLDDPEGDLLQAVRRVVAPELPVVATLDCHAHVTEQMTAHADALVAWETYPHRDTFTTGERGARLLLDAVAGRTGPTMVAAKVPVLVGALLGNTEGEGPFADVMRLAKEMERRPGVLSASAIMVHPNLDVPHTGSGGIAVTDNDPALAATLAAELAEAYWARRHDLEPPLFKPTEAVARGLKIEGSPVVLVETADCCGGGAAGDSVHTLRALLDANPEGIALVPLVDPHAAAECLRAGVGAEVILTLGHRIDPRWGEPITVRGKVEHVLEGRFLYSGGIWEGQSADMGLSAVLAIGSVRVLITTHATYDWADEQFRAAGLDPTAAKFIVAKNPMNYRHAYGGIMRAALFLDTPGPTPPTLRNIPFRRITRPWFPRDGEIPNPVTVYRSRASARFSA
jgi:microcystin degradation protein MlrC